MKPNREAIKEWVDALRSDKFPQGQGVLARIDGSFCCLGVACEVFHEKAQVERTVLGPHIAYDRNVVALPTQIATYLGLSLVNPHVPLSLLTKLEITSLGGRTNVAGDSVSFARLNDAGVTFSRIADLIEATYLT